MTLVLAACELRFGATPTPSPAPTEPPRAVVTVVWADGGDLLAWREGETTPRTLATGAVIQPYLAPDGQHVAFTRGVQGDARALWAVGIDGAGERELVAPDVIPPIREGHPQIGRVAWLDDQTIYFGTYQQHDWGDTRDDNLYRIELDGKPQLILPPGAGGAFALSPDGGRIAVARAGIYDMQKGSVALLDPLGVVIDEKLTFTALSAPSETSFYPPLVWSEDGAFVRVPIPDRESDRVALWRIPVEGEARIFGYVSAARDGLPVWSGERMLYLRYGETGAPELVIADANGENPQVYASGVANPRWIPGERFVYEHDGALWLGQAGQAPLLLDHTPAQPIIFLPDGAIVFAVDGALRRGFVGGAQPEVIAAISGDARFDAVAAP